ncbi:hypothetical protein L6452_05625 [Arctium lappa]|uniref:Uncharacterized protein n=1 Tax=Arctium lappa TaxID=4217 RepID=A0ACB9EGW6_ARCLA|nr:hypothetical protein L6452_05625 [Arctium lappa]
MTSEAMMKTSNQILSEDVHWQNFTDRTEDTENLLCFMVKKKEYLSEESYSNCEVNDDSLFAFEDQLHETMLKVSDVESRLKKEKRSSWKDFTSKHSFKEYPNDFVKYDLEKECDNDFNEFMKVPKPLDERAKSATELEFSALMNAPVRLDDLNNCFKTPEFLEKLKCSNSDNSSQPIFKDKGKEKVILEPNFVATIVGPEPSGLAYLSASCCCQFVSGGCWLLAYELNDLGMLSDAIGRWLMG